MPRFVSCRLCLSELCFGVFRLCPAGLGPGSLDKNGFFMGTSLPVIFADACASGNYPDIDQVEVPESAQLCIPGDGDVEGVAQLDGAVHACRGGGAVGGINGVGNVVDSVNLCAEELEEGVRFPIDAARELYLLYHLVGAVVKLLLGGDDAEQVDDEGQQQDGDEDEHHCTEVIDFAAVIFQSACHSMCFCMGKQFVL